jgi:hypothetical protein
MVFYLNGDNLPRRLDARRSSMGYIQSKPHTVGAHWGYIVARPPRRRCWRSILVEVTILTGGVGDAGRWAASFNNKLNPRDTLPELEVNDG